MFASFGVAAMIVALVGLYGVMAHAVVRRTREIGIRIAVGAEPGAVRRMILGESLATHTGRRGGGPAARRSRSAG